jgi:hypothetical protein
MTPIWTTRWSIRKLPSSYRRFRMKPSFTLSRSSNTTTLMVRFMLAMRYLRSRNFGLMIRTFMRRISTLNVPSTAISTQRGSSSTRISPRVSSI